MKYRVVPFLVPPEDSVSHGGWRLATPVGDIALPEDIPHWDFQSELHLYASVSVDRARIAYACDLGPDSMLEIVVIAKSSRTGIHKAVAKEPVPPQDRFDMALELKLEGRELGGRLTLETLLVAHPSASDGILAPWRPGSILLRLQHSSMLEGIGDQFPTDTADFPQTRPSSAAAAWELNLNLDDMDALFMSSVRLTLNSSNESIQKLLAGTLDEATQQLRRVLIWDVTRQLALRALDTPEVIASEVEYGGSTVRAVLRSIIASVFGNEAPEVLVGWMRNDPQRLETLIQSRSGLVI